MTFTFMVTYTIAILFKLIIVVFINIKRTGLYLEINLQHIVKLRLVTVSCFD